MLAGGTQLAGAESIDLQLRQRQLSTSKSCIDHLNQASRDTYMGPIVGARRLYYCFASDEANKS